MVCSKFNGAPFRSVANHDLSPVTQKNFLLFLKDIFCLCNILYHFILQYFNVGKVLFYNKEMEFKIIVAECFLCCKYSHSCK